MKLWSSPKKLFKAKVPDLSKYIGRDVVIRETIMLEGQQTVISKKKVKIEKIVGNVGMTLGRSSKEIRPTFYEINDKHLIGMLRFHAQMENDTSITEEDFLAFENMDVSAEKLPEDGNEIQNI